MKALLVIAALAAWLPAVTAAYALTAEEAKSQAAGALNAREFDRAISLLEATSSDNPFDGMLKELLGQAYLARGWDRAAAEKFDAALDDFKKADRSQGQKNPGTYLGLGYAYYRLKQGDDALYYLQQAVDLAPKDTKGRMLLGQIYYERGRLQDAVSEWSQALEASPSDQALKGLLDKAKKELGVEESFTKRETYYFNIKYEGEEKRELGDDVLKILQEVYGNVGGDLGYYPREPVTVILYTRRQFKDVTDAPSWSGGVFDGTIRIPVGGADIDRASLSAVLHHEYTHAVIRMVAGNRLPTWLDEGIAQYEERWARPPKVELASAAITPLGSLTGSFMKISDPEVVKRAYAESLSAVDFYVTRFGMFSLSKLVRLAGEGGTLDSAMLDAAGVPLDEFERLWQGSLVR